MKKEIKTKIYHYRYDISKKEEKAQYKKEVEKAKKLTQLNKPNTTHYINFEVYGREKYNSFDNKIKALKTVTIETKHLFSNQFNTKEGLRIFIWSEYEFINKDTKKGYYIEMIEELQEALNNTFSCGYCGKQYTREEKEKKDFSFCDSCLDSKYLKEDSLFLLRLKRINDKTDRLPLNDCDKGALLKAYKESQIYGKNKRGIERTKKAYNNIEEEYNQNKENNEIEYKGKKWLLDNKIKFSLYENCIYYSHCKTWSFGWRNKLNFEEEQYLKEKLKGFPFKYELKV